MTTGGVVMDTPQREAKFTAVNIPNQSPLVLQLKVGWRKGKALVTEEDKVTGHGVLEYAAEKTS
jgi:hypothetical protein